jgi:hypothetical protein
MLVLYYPPFRADDDVELADQAVMALRAYVEDLSEFVKPVLVDAWREIRRVHKTERWPTIQVLRHACKENVAGPASNGAPIGIRRQREEHFHRTGHWMDSWGDRPASRIDQHALHERVMASLRQGLSDEEIARREDVQRRLANGESVVTLFPQDDANEMPLLPGERGGKNRESVRAASIRRAEDAA